MLYLLGNNKNMKEYEIKVLIETLTKNLNESEQMWKDKEVPHAQIVGYLQGTVKGIISHLESKI